MLVQSKPKFVALNFGFDLVKHLTTISKYKIESYIKLMMGGKSSLMKENMYFIDSFVEKHLVKRIKDVNEMVDVGITPDKFKVMLNKIITDAELG